MRSGTDAVWRERLENIATPVESIQLPSAQDRKLSQDEEWCFVTIEGDRRRIRFHDYAAIYEIPGLYERLFYDRLECSSPYRVTRLLSDVLAERGVEPRALRVLDLGAGNGMVGDELRALGVQTIIGTDILPEAREAALRDRKGIYKDYLVSDTTALSEEDERRMIAAKLNCLTTVATLGFNDVPPEAFLKALSFISSPGWLAFNIKEDFLGEKDDSGFAGVVRELNRREVIRFEAYRRYRHRLSVRGEPLYYVAIVATKRGPVPPALL